MAHISEVETYLQPRVVTPKAQPNSRVSWNGKLFLNREGNLKEEEGKLLTRGSRTSIEAWHTDKRTKQRKVLIVTEYDM